MLILACSFFSFFAAPACTLIVQYSTQRGRMDSAPRYHSFNGGGVEGWLRAITHSAESNAVKFTLNNSIFYNRIPQILYLHCSTSESTQNRISKIITAAIQYCMIGLVSEIFIKFFHFRTFFCCTVIKSNKFFQ